MTSLVCLPAQYIAGRMMLVRGLVLGLAMTLVEPAANPLATLPDAPSFDFAAFIPLQLETLLADSARAKPSTPRMPFSWAAVLSARHSMQRSRLCAPVFHTYGMTETATHVALRRLSGPTRSAAFVPLPGVDTRLDARGCIALRGPMTLGAWVQTNDVATLHADGSFVWLGRADNVINTGGIKVHIEPLEAALEPLLPEFMGNEWDGRRFAVAGVSDERLGEQVVLILEGAPLTDAVAHKLLGALRGRLGPFEAPRRLLYASHFAATETGKIDRAATLSRAQTSQTDFG